MNASGEYGTRLEARRQTRDSLDRVDARMAQARLAAFAALVVIAIFAWRSNISWWWLPVPAAIFAWLVYRHDQVLRARSAALRGISFYERGIARLEDRWIGTGERGERFRTDDHPYANDLDLFGRGSLFELLSLARTRTGEETLATWLTTSATGDEVRARQEAVQELAPALDLRERLALAGADVRAAVHTDRLLAWAQAPVGDHHALRTSTWFFTVAAAVAMIFTAVSGQVWPLVSLAVMEAIVFHRLRDQMDTIVSGPKPFVAAGAGEPEASFDFVGDALTHRALDLDVVAEVLTHLERHPFACSRLASLQGRLIAGARPASRIIRRLHRLSGIRDSASTMTLYPLGLLLIAPSVPPPMSARLIQVALALVVAMQLVGPHLAMAVRRWRHSHGNRVPVWLETVAEFEALSSLSGYRYEHVEDPFPAIVSTAEARRQQTVFEGRQLGHPLLPASGMVRNDVDLAGGTQLLVVSGSNMSGKSTLLRTVGINAVMALAGAPVRARSLRITPLAIGATLRIQDSLQQGRSRFFAEITRIRELAEVAARGTPLLFLLDELLHGTNSHDRLVGAAGVLRSFLDRGAAGLITTHDLALTAVADQLAPRAANVHFEDRFEEGEISFDYVMKPGPVTHSNAVALMRAIGLDVPAE
jgi:hypothetical protein